MCGWFGEGWRGCTLSASRFRAVQRLDSKERKTGCRTAEFDTASASWRAPLSKASTSMTPAQSSCQYDLAPGHRVVAAFDHPAMAEVPVGDVGKFSKPAQLRFSSKPAPHGPSSDTKIRLPPGSRTRSTAPNPSSPSHSSPSAATHHGSHAETNPHIQQESPICAVASRGHRDTSASFSDGVIHPRVHRCGRGSRSRAAVTVAHVDPAKSAKNCDVSGFENGIRLGSADGNVVVDNTSHGNGERMAPRSGGCCGVVH